MSTPDPLPISLRVFTEPAGRRRRPAVRPSGPEPRSAFVFDTETGVDLAQRLNFGVWWFGRWLSPDPEHFDYREALFVCYEEMVSHADDLPRRYPEGYEVLKDYCHRNAATTAAEPLRIHQITGEIPYTAPLLYLVSETEMLRWLRLAACYDDGSGAGGSHIVGFNLPYDLSRLATRWGRATKGMRGGFSLGLWAHDGRESPFLPRVLIKNLGTPKQLIRLGSRFPGHFLDLHMLGFALSNRRLSLAKACELYEVPGWEELKDRKQNIEHGKITPEYIDYCRFDVRMESLLYERMLHEHCRHPIAVPATAMFSPASPGKGYLAQMGIQPRLDHQPRFPRTILGITFTSFGGGRVECRCRRLPFEISYLDFLSMYTSVNALMGIWELVIADRIEVHPATRKARRFLHEVTRDDLMRKETWRQLRVFCRIRLAGENEPADIVSVRANYASATTAIGSNPVHRSAHVEDLWVSLAELAGSKMKTHGRVPEVLEAFELVPIGQQDSLQSVKLRGEIEIDPRREDFFKRVIELRKQHQGDKTLSDFLKTLASAASYGINAQVTAKDSRDGAKQIVDVYGKDEHFQVAKDVVEEAGPYCFPPIAALITSGARLMLALLESFVTEPRGAWVFADTDSMAICSSRKGGLVPCPGGPHRDGQGRACVKSLSWRQVEQIRARFKTLNPYDPKLVPGSILELEKEDFELDPSDPSGEKVLEGRRRPLFAYSISAKRYCLFNRADDGKHPVFDGELIMRKCSEHSLGQLMDPYDPKMDEPDDPADDHNPDKPTPPPRARRWIEECWRWIVLTDGYGLDAPEPSFLDLPALRKRTITTPNLLDALKSYNAGPDQGEWIRPYNFFVCATVARFGYPLGVDEARFALIAPFESDPSRWRDIEWTNHYQPRSRYRITAKPLGHTLEPNEVRVKTYRDVLNEFRTHPEPKSLGPDGKPCHRGTVGWLSPRPVTPTSITYTGPQHKIEEAMAGLVTDPDELEEVYAKERFAPVSDLVRLVIESFGESAAETARRAGVSKDSVLKMRRGEPLDRIRRDKFGRYAVDRARGLVRTADPDAKVRSIHDETLLTRYLELTGHGRRPLWELVRDVIRALSVEQVAAGAGVSARTIERACAQQAEKAVYVAVNERGEECGHHHYYWTEAVTCRRRKERRYRRA
jgi:hypothetical protein